MLTSTPTVKLVEVTNEGLVSLIDQTVTFFCVNYFYTGKIVGVNDHFVKITNASVVFETGPFTDKDWKDAQKLPNDIYVMLSAIESFTILK